VLGQVVGIGNLANKLDIDADRATIRKGIECKIPGMRDIEFHVCDPMLGSKSRLAVLGLNEFDRSGGDAQAFGEQPPQASAGYDVVLPMLGVAKFLGAFPLVARQNLPERRAHLGRRIKVYAYDI
jgi:hypothetical protein